jgi:O-antigen/teichoic acid export membrane protein
MSVVSKNKFVKSIGSYTLVNIINKGIPFLLLPVLTHYLTTKDYGIITNIESLITITVTLVGINFSAAVTRQYVKKEVDIKGYFMSAFRVVLISFVIVSILFSSLASLIANFIDVPVEIIYVISFYAIMHNIIEVLLAIWRMQDKPFNYGVFRIVRTLIEVSISIVMVVSYNYGWLGRFSGIYIAGIVGGLVAILIFIKKGYFKGKYKKEYKTHFLKFGLPLIPHTISGVLIMYSDKIIITNYIDQDANGTYSVAFMIGMAISLLQNSFNQAWVPWLFKKLALNSLKEKQKLVKMTYIYMIVMLIFVFLLWSVTPFVYHFIGADFSGGIGIVAIIGLGFAFNGMYKMMVNYMFYAEKTQIISLITISVAILNIVLSIYLIRDHGILGPAYASAITFFIQFIVTWYVSNKIYPMPWFKFK